MRKEMSQRWLAWAVAFAWFGAAQAWAAGWTSDADAFSAVVAGLVLVVFCLSAAYSFWEERRQAPVSKVIRDRLRKAA